MEDDGRATETPILLLHGIWNAKAWLTPLARRLRAHGFAVTVFGYPSIAGGPEVAVPRLSEYLQQQSSPVHLVGHSLGGLVALEALRRQPQLQPQVARAVCLGAPLLGSQAARNLARQSWSASLLGRSGRLLQDGCPPWQGTVQVGMVAGNVARGMGRLMAHFEGDSDGTVALAETRLPGLADHCVVAASHTGLVFSRDAAAQAAHFLRRGRFASATD